MLLYKVQCGAFRIKRNAEKQATKIIEKTGLKPAIIREGLNYKVQCGAFANKTNAMVRQVALGKAGFDSVLVPVYDMKSEAQDRDKTVEHSATGKIRVYPICFFEKNESLYGDCTAIIEYAEDDVTVKHCILIDTAMAGASSVIIDKLRKLGISVIDALVISHAHGDHYGGNTKIFEAFPVKHLYLPDCKQLDKYQKPYGNAIRNQEKKANKYKTGVTYLTTGKSFTVGSIDCNCVYQLPASAVSEHDNHHFVNNESIVLRFTLNGKWIFHTAGDLQNAGNNALIKAVPNLRAHIYKCQWHGDGNACNEAICRHIKPIVAFFNYHHKESKGGRQLTRKRLEAVGALVMRNHEEGDIYIDCYEDKMVVTCSKKKDFRKEFKYVEL